MGKIADALERHNKEQSTKVEFLTNIKSQNSVTEEREISYARDFCTLHECSPTVIVLSAPDSVDTENFRILRTQILFPRAGKIPRTIMVTSTFPGEGKSFVAANLAVSMALGVDESVLLVDCDLRRPSLQEVFQYPSNSGLIEFFTGEKQLAELIIKTQIDKLSILPAGKPTPSPAELMSSVIMKEFIEEISGQHQDRFVVIDSAPCQTTAEANVLAKYVDAIILVVMAQKSPKHAIQKAIQDLGREKILGIVFNGYDTARRGYKKYHEKYYGKQ